MRKHTSAGIARSRGSRGHPLEPDSGSLDSLGRRVGLVAYIAQSSMYAMLLNSASALNRAFRGLPEVPQTYENTAHGGPSVRRTEARRVLEPRCAVFDMYAAPTEALGRPDLKRRHY